MSESANIIVRHFFRGDTLTVAYMCHEDAKDFAQVMLFDIGKGMYGTILTFHKTCVLVLDDMCYTTNTAKHLLFARPFCAGRGLPKINRTPELDSFSHNLIRNNNFKLYTTKGGVNHIAVYDDEVLYVENEWSGWIVPKQLAEGYKKQRHKPSGIVYLQMAGYMTGKSGHTYRILDDLPKDDLMFWDSERGTESNANNNVYVIEMDDQNIVINIHLHKNPIKTFDEVWYTQDKCISIGSALRGNIIGFKRRVH